MRLHRFINAVWKDFWGKDVPVKQWVESVDVEIVDTRPYDNGYEVVNIQVAKTSGEGGFIESYIQRVFDKPVEVDYFGGSDWYERGANWQFIGGPWRAHISKSERYIDNDGQPIEWSDIK